MNLRLSNRLLKIRMAVANLRRRIDPWYRAHILERKLANLEENLYYELELDGVWRPRVLGTEETLERMMERKCSLARFGDGEFELMAGRSMSFEISNHAMASRLKEILQNPLESCLVCVPNVFGSLARYRPCDRLFWRGAATWMRPILRSCLSAIGDPDSETLRELGDTQVSRAYLGIDDVGVAERTFGLWKMLFAGRRLLIVEGRFSRLGIGNDLFAGASSIARIWCPAHGAYAHYDEIYQTIVGMRNDFDLVVLALGATATILAYDLSKVGVWAVDAGHVDLEYIWMSVGAKEKCPIPGRYVNECAAGREMICVAGEEAANNVIRKIGVA